MWIFTSDLNYKSGICVIIAVLCSIIPSVLGGCGGYIELSSGDSRDIGTASSYAHYANCIWVIKAPAHYQIQATITFKGQSFGGNCVDTLQIKEGSSSSEDILSQTCGDLTNHVVTSSYRWMWIQFQADGAVTTTGLFATLTIVYAGPVIANATDPRRDCKTHEYSCANTECITRSYLCDKFNDCGCEDKGCDEVNCEGLPFSKYVGYGIGAGLGAGIFLIIYFSVYAYERRRRNAAKRKEKFEKLKEEIAKHGGRMPKDLDAKGKTKKGKKKDVYWIR